MKKDFIKNKWLGLFKININRSAYIKFILKEIMGNLVVNIFVLHLYHTTSGTVQYANKIDLP